VPAACMEPKTIQVQRYIIHHKGLITMGDYSIWVLEYAYVPDYPVSGVIYGAHNEGTVKLPYCYALIKGQGRTILVDVGFNFKDYGGVLGERFGVINWQDPRTVLDEVGVTPEQVDTVFITHAHFDHFGNVMDFPKAKFYIQEKEIAKWMWAMSLPQPLQWLTAALDPGDIVRGAELAKDGRLVLIDGDQESVLPGIDLCAAFDSHTFASQFVRVRNSDGSWILAGDLVYKFENTQGRNGDGMYRPIGLASGSQVNLLLATDRMMEMTDRDAKRVIPIHEERLTEIFPNRKTAKGLNVIEIVLADGEISKVR
jgi:N-acyl homoserine lactone hydrolase